MRIMYRHFIITALLCCMSASAAVSQSTVPLNKRVAVEGDWGVYVEEKFDECWVASVARKSVNTRGGKQVNNVKRGDILLFATFRGRGDTSPEVAFTGGYPFAPESKVQVQIGSDNFELIVSGEWSWAVDDAADSAIVAAMKKGATAVLTARSKRGTTTKDSFSLRGVTAALTEAQRRCK